MTVDIGIYGSALDASDVTPTPEQVAAFMGLPEPTAELLSTIGWSVAVTSLAARAYTRGNGFSLDGTECTSDIASVVLTSAARLASNPTNATRIEAGSWNTVPGQFAGWTFAELMVLHNYRRRTA